MWTVRKVALLEHVQSQLVLFRVKKNTNRSKIRKLIIEISAAILRVVAPTQVVTHDVTRVKGIHNQFI